MTKTIAVIFGGKSAEHDVSIVTAHIPIIETLLATGAFDVWPIYITKEGKWYADKAMNDLAFFRDKSYTQKLAGMKQVQLSFENGFDIFGSAVAMDKVLTKQVVSAEGMQVVPYVWFTRAAWGEKAPLYRAEIAKLGWPLFVKPVHLGSSIGIAKVKNERELEEAIEVALHFDHKVLVEKGIEPLIEITLTIMGNDVLRTAECERPLNKTEFFAFKDKYLSGGVKKGGEGGVNSRYSEVPAEIGPELTRTIKDIGMRVYRALDLGGVARVDFLVDADTKEVYVNEVNTLPGSLYHHNWKKAGVSNMELVTGLVRLAEERADAQKSTQFTFESDILQKVGGPKVHK